MRISGKRGSGKKGAAQNENPDRDKNGIGRSSEDE